MKSIFDYINYKVFLVESFEKMKARNSHFSLGVWCKILGLDSTSTLSKILNGNRHPGGEVAKKLSLYFNHNKDEEFFFLLLIKMHAYLDEEIIVNILKQTAFGIKARMLHKKQEHSSYNKNIDN